MRRSELDISLALSLSEAHRLDEVTAAAAIDLEIVGARRVRSDDATHEQS